MRLSILPSLSTYLGWGRISGLRYISVPPTLQLLSESELSSRTALAAENGLSPLSSAIESFFWVNGFEVKLLICRLKEPLICRSPSRKPAVLLTRDSPGEGDRIPSGASCKLFIFFARPKSPTYNRPLLGFTKMFSGLMSRWMRLCEWMYFRACISCSNSW